MKTCTDHLAHATSTLTQQKGSDMQKREWAQLLAIVSITALGCSAIFTVPSLFGSPSAKDLLLTGLKNLLLSLIVSTVVTAEVWVIFSLVYRRKQSHRKHPHSPQRSDHDAY